MAQLTDSGMLSNVVGTLPAESQAMFERLVFRIGRGNVHVGLSRRRSIRKARGRRSCSARYSRVQRWAGR